MSSFWSVMIAKLLNYAHMPLVVRITVKKALRWCAKKVIAFAASIGEPPPSTTTWFGLNSTKRTVPTTTVSIFGSACKSEKCLLILRARPIQIIGDVRDLVARNKKRVGDDKDSPRTAHHVRQRTFSHIYSGNRRKLFQNLPP